ncbi:MAG: hypothetical protein JF616_11495 [Fibrobacteres bacterium]|nr:hypothetical protein [Fibrobacterota bacterium]
MKSSEGMLIAMAVAGVAMVPLDMLYTSRFVPRFQEIEKQRIITSNQIATAKIVSENLNHVRDLVFRNMSFAGQKDSVSHEAILFEFLTTCVNDLKMKLVSVRPSTPSVQGRVNINGYDIVMEGDFFRFGEFCSKLENSQRLLAVTAFEVSQHGKEAEPSAPAKGGKTAATHDSAPEVRGTVIKLHLDTFVVRKGG